MAKKTIKAQMKQRRDTKANWAATNPVLLDGELGIVSDDPNLYKVGDGATAWNSLPFRGFDGTLAQELGTSPNAVISQKVVSEKLTELESKKVITFQVASSQGSSLLSMSEGDWGYNMYSDKPTLRTADGIADAEWDTNTIYRYHNVSFCRKGNEFRLLDKIGTLSAYVTSTPVIADGSLYYDYALHTLRVIAEISVGASFPIQFAEETIFLYLNTLVKIQDGAIVPYLDSEGKIQNIVDILNLNLINLSSINVEDGYFLGAAGARISISDTTYKLITYKIEDYRGGIIEVESRVLASNASYALLNSNGDLIAFGANNKPDGHHVITHRFIVPEDAVVLWLSHYGEDGSYSARVADTEAGDESYEAIAVKVASLEKSIENLEVANDSTEDVTISAQFENNTYMSLASEKGSYDGIGLFTLSVKEGDRFQITSAMSWLMFRSYLIADASGNIIEHNPIEEDSAKTNRDYLVTIPTNGVTLYVHQQSGYTTKIEKLVSSTQPNVGLSLKGKKWVCIGDSLTEHNLRATKNYHDYIAEATGIEVVNMGRSGTGYKRTEDEGFAFYQRVANIPTDADVITIFGSGNDNQFVGSALGKASDSGTETLGGCINTTIDAILAKMPMAVIGIISPTPWIGYSPNNKGNVMDVYSELLKEICTLRGIPFLDLYHCSGLRPDDATFRSLAYSRDEGNGVHPDENGHKLIAPRFKAFLETLVL